MNQGTSRGITILRVIAMFYVCLGNHYLPRYFPGFITHAIGQFFGFAGVGAFFAASGFLFGNKMRQGQSIGTIDWLLARMKKILIPYWCVLAVVIIIRLLKGQSVTWQDTLVSVLNLQGIVQLRWGFGELGHLWFLSIMMVCYCLVPFLARNVQNYRFMAIIYGVFVVLLISASVALKVTTGGYIADILCFTLFFHLGYLGAKNEMGGGYCNAS